MTRLQLTLVLLAVVALAPLAAAQDRPVVTERIGLLNAPARAHVVEGDPLLFFTTVRVEDGRWDVAANVLRAAYRLEAPAFPGAPEAAARAYLAAEAARYGLDPAHLAAAGVLDGRYSAHVVFRQTFFGVPVYNRQVKVSLTPDGRPTMVLSGYAPHLDRIDAFDARPALAAADVPARVATFIKGEVRTGTPELLVHPAAQPRLVWRVVAWTAADPAEWEVLLDARTGAPVQFIDLSTHGREDAATPAPVPGALSPMPQAGAGAGLQRIDGVGNVFVPDPVTSAGASYGGGYVDADDADTDLLDQQLKEVVLRDITLREGRYYLEGPYVTITGTGGFASYTPPAEPTPVFRYTRSNPFFEAVMAYYHIDTSQRYAQALDVGRPIREAPIRVNPRGSNADNSEYFGSQNLIYFGTGGVDDAEDAAVIWHEYAHALLDASAPGLLSSTAGQALHEGWADYWAASYVRGVVEQSNTPQVDWRKLFRWDGNHGTWCGRWLDHPGRYPDQTAYTAPGDCYLPALYQSGMLWATTLMQIYDDLGKTITDRLNLASHAYIGVQSPFTDAAEALIQADADLYGGAHAAVLIRHLGARGYVDPDDYRPALVHTPLVATEQQGGAVEVTAEAVGRSAPVDSVVVWYRYDAGAFSRLLLAPQAQNRYTGQLPLPTRGTVTYFVEAVDAAGRRTRMPETAPGETYRFDVGPDEEPPAITHTPLQAASVIGWPAEVSAGVTDNLGVDSVWVDFSVHDAQGRLVQEGRFGLRLVGGRYRAPFPIDALDLPPGSTVTYRLHARDRSVRANTSALPSSGAFSFEIIREGVLLSYDFEGGNGLEGTGVWAAGRPTYGVTVAHSGERVWATAPGGAYPNTAARSSLYLPPLNLQGLGTVYLTFWHWYDLEHDGSAQPGSYAAGRTLWDGGNVKVSTDGGATWRLLSPQGGYNGVVPANTANPLGGEPAFGGYSYGWRREVVALPDSADVRLRFDLGTDQSNEDVSLYFAGWYLDDLAITTALPADVAAPTATLLPPAFQLRDAGQLPPPFVVQATDDTGLRDVFADYTIVSDGRETSGALRLAMSESDLTLYRGTLQPAAPFEPGDRLLYRLRLEDYAGNRRVYPAEAEAPLVIEYRYREVAGVLNDLRASGLWYAVNGGWGLGEAGADVVADGRSSLVLPPLDLPANAAPLNLTLTHQYRLEGGGGNVKLSADGGRTWTVLAPDDGYPATLAQDAGHALAGEAAFAGRSEGRLQTTFDLRPYAGTQVRLRIDFAAAGPLGGDEFWSIRAADLVASTPDPTLDTPRAFALHPNFPNPFRDHTTLSYTLPEPLPVHLEVYDLLGRRVAELANETQEAGTYTLTFDGSRLSSGVYFVRIQAGGHQAMRRLVLAR